MLSPSAETHLNDILPASLAVFEGHFGVGELEKPAHHRPSDLGGDAGVLEKVHRVLKSVHFRNLRDAHCSIAFANDVVSDSVHKAGPLC